MQAGGRRFESGILHRRGRRPQRGGVTARTFSDMMERMKQEYKSENTERARGSC